MSFSKINDYLEKYKVGVAYSFILVSILSMSSLIYKVANPIYKGLSALVFVFILVSLLGGFKKIKADVKFLILFGLVAGSHLLSALVNRSGNFLGNITEVIFMVTYILLFVMLEAKQLQKVFQMTAITVQVISFLSALFALILFFARVLILFKVGDRSYSYGVLNGRVWGIVNPNASAIFTYISIVLALYLIHQGHKYSVYFKINNIIQVIYFALMQSRGALLSLLLMIGLYFAFVARGNIVKRLISFLTVAILVFGTNVGISFAASKYITSSRATVFNFDKTTKISDNASSSSEVANELHLIETTPSGRTNIWKNALKMGSVKPVFGYGVRNVPNYYSQYFSKYEIQNSLIGGNFHNIFITVFVSSGIVGLVAFMMLLGYIIQRFVRYLFISKKNSDK